MGVGKFLTIPAVMAIVVVIISEPVFGGILSIGKINPGFEGGQMDFISNDGLFLVSNSSQFAFGFETTKDVTLFLLVVIHMKSRRIIWTANPASPVSNDDKFSFDKTGRISLQKGGVGEIWSINSTGTVLELWDSGNLVLRGDGEKVIWESFSHPRNTLLQGQDFVGGMTLESNPNPKNMTYFLEIKSGDMTLYAGFETPQPYWSMRKDNRRVINKAGGEVSVAVIGDKSWNFYDKNRILLWGFPLPSSGEENVTWIAVLGEEGFVSFADLASDPSSAAATKMPSDACSTPMHCDAYYECFGGGDNKCQCPSGLSSRANCSGAIATTLCDGGNSASTDTEMVNAGDGVYYFALEFASPSSRGRDLIGCKNSCQKNCSCLAMFFQNSSGDCFHFDRIGNFQSSNKGTSFVSYVKVLSSSESTGESNDSKKHFPYVVIIVLVTVLVICSLIYLGYRFHTRKANKLPESPRGSSEEDNFLESLVGMPVRYSYADLLTATDNFSQKLGQGGFGSVYQGALPDGTRIAVKKLEGIGQGKKEFRAEVSIIGSIHHLHLVRLRGFCAEGSHRLLAYEFMANGSLERWIFRRDGRVEHALSWAHRFTIAVGTAKGLAYLHEDCDAKIIHCDIKPENVLLDENFQAKVSDFGLAKLMTREQSHVFTTMRGTRGYLAPEWITNYAISEKSDVYSYGMLLLEIIGGRKNYDPSESSEKSHFPSYAFKMLEEGKLRDALDWKAATPDDDERVGRSIKVALWCIQEDMSLRPSMAKVVQMLEGLCPVATPPTSSPIGMRFYSGFLKSTSGEGTSSGLSEYNSDAYLSAVRLSGPR